MVTSTTTSLVRVYAVAAAVVVFFVAWAIVATRPWGEATPDPRLEALGAREQRIRRESVAVQQLVDRRWQLYRLRLAERQRAIASVRALNAERSFAASQAAAVPAPVVRVARLAPVTQTRSS